MNVLRKNMILLLIISYCIPLQGQDAKEIIRKSEENVRGTKSAISVMSIVVKRPKWTRTIEMKIWQKGSKYSMVLITAPAKEKGTAFLKKDKEVWSYMPSVEKAIKMPPSMMMRNWMGTDFTNDDLVKESSMTDDYNQKIIGDSTILARKCYKIELLPKPEAAVVWGKVILYIDKKDFIQLRSEMYDEDEYLINVINSFDIKMMDGRLIATKMVLIPVEKKNQKTILIIKNIQFDKPLEDSFFSIQNMKNAR